MLSIQNVRLGPDEVNEVVHAGSRRSPRNKAAKTRHNAMVYGSLAAASTAAALGGAHLYGNPGLRKKIAKTVRKVRAKVSSRVRIIKRGSSAKVLRRRTGVDKGITSLRNKRLALARSKGKTPRVLPDRSGIKRGPSLSARTTAAHSGKGRRYKDPTAWMLSWRNKRTNARRVANIKRSRVKRY